MSVRLTLEGGNLVYTTPYSPALVSALKLEVPACSRRWDPQRRAWLVAPQYAASLVTMTERHLGVRLPDPTIGMAAAAPTMTRILDVRYIGCTKEHGGSERLAFGYVGTEWGAVFPESVLRAWFLNEARPDEAPTLYGTLGVAKSATESDIRTSFRRLARQWHPDVCAEPGAAEVFRSLKHAYDVLSDARCRAKYDAGLALQSTLGQRPTQYVAPQGYRPPLRCGLIMAAGVDQLGRFVVSTIYAWQDIADAAGRVLSTSWPAGAQSFVETWL
jgi:hypothetical protein